MAGPGAVSIPETVANRAHAAGAQWWLDGLDQLIASLAAEWGLRRSGEGYPGGTEALVLPVQSDEFGPAVLKLMVPHPSSTIEQEATVLRLVGGDGCAALYRDDVNRGAVLIERLGPSLNDLGVAIDERHRILCRTAARVWRRVDETVNLPTGARKAEWLAVYITSTWEELNRPCSVAAVDHSLRCAERRRMAHDPATAVLVHGDVQEWNTLLSLDGSDHKLIDPDGLIAEAEYDLGVILREDPVELLEEAEPIAVAHRLTSLASAHTQIALDPTAVWEWGVVERVSTGLMATKIELQPIGREMLRAADELAARYRPEDDPA